MKTYLLSGLIALCLLSAPLDSSALAAQTVDNGPAARMLLELFHNLKNTVNDNAGKIPNEEIDGKLRDFMVPRFDFFELSRNCIGPAWDKASPEEQKEFAVRFRDLLANNFMGIVRNNVGDANMLVDDATKKGNRARVRVQFNVDNDSANVKFILSSKEGKWRVSNILVGAFDLEKIYYAQFAHLAKREGVAGLLKRMREKG